MHFIRDNLRLTAFGVNDIGKMDSKKAAESCFM